MSKYHIKEDHATPNKPTQVTERSENGALLAEYVGYYDYKRNTFRLYPKYNPFAANTGKKHEVAATLVRFGGL